MTKVPVDLIHITKRFGNPNGRCNSNIGGTRILLEHAGSWLLYFCVYLLVDKGMLWGWVEL